MAAVALLGAWPALWIGLSDLISPVSFSSQALGLLFTAAGALIVIGLLWVIAVKLSPGVIVPLNKDEKKHDVRVRRLMFLGALASVLVSAIVAISSLEYREEWVILFSLVAIDAAILALLIGHSDSFSSMTSAIGSSVLAGGTLVAVASFTYQNIYVPANTEVGIHSSASLGRVLAPSRDVTLIPVRIVTEDTSNVGAVVLSSLVTITGVAYTGDGQAHLSKPAAQSHELRIADDLGQREQNVGTFDDLFAGREHRSVLAATKIFRDGSAIFPNAKYSYELVVAVSRQRYQEIDVHQEIFYAGSDRLTLSSNGSFHRRTLANGSCRNDARKEWSLRESELRSFTRGNQILATDWCADRGHEWAGGFVRNEGIHTSSAILARNARLYGLHSASHYERLPLS